jgi:hypothetical protein
MAIKTKVISLVFTLLFSVPASANVNEEPWEIPKLVSFDFSPTEVELTKVDPTISVSFKVSHPIGIKSEKVTVYLKNSLYPSMVSYQFNAVRSDSPIEPSLKTVSFTGSFKIPTSTLPGVWNISTDPVQGLASSRAAGWPESGSFTPANFRDMPGAESSLLIRLNSDLKFDFQTFVGPAFRSEITATDGKPLSLNVEAPIWKINEVIELKNYFQMRVQGVQLELFSKTPQICQAIATSLKLVATGECNYRVFTAKNMDYLYKELNLFSTVTQARVKPELSIPKIENQTSVGLPKTITREQVNSYGVPVVPQSLTPGICLPTNSGVTLFSGGKCILEYSTKPSLTLLASDVYTQSFEVVRDPQTITFTPPATANLASRTVALSATASSGGVVTYATTSTGICSITGSTLNLLMRGNCAVTATQAGTTTLAPISATATVMIAGATAPSRKTITCVKGNKSKKVSGTNPKCPTGYKLKR